MIEYAVHPPVLGPSLAAHLREQGYEITAYGARVWATAATAAAPTEERLFLGNAVAEWRRAHPDARVDLQGFAGPGT